MDFDPQSFNVLFQTLEKGISTASRAADLATTIKKLARPSEKTSDAELAGAISELVNQVADTKIANADLKLKLMELQDAYIKLQAEKSDLDRYELWKTPAGHLVYQLKEAAQADTPPHYICPQCYVDGKKSILQGSRYRKTCTTCSVHYAIEKQPAREPVRYRHGII